MAQLVWRTDSCLPRFTGRSEVKAVHLLELKNAAVVDFNAIAAKMEETSDRALAEMTALGGQVDRRAANVTNLERLVDQIRHRIEVLEIQQAGILVHMATPPSGMTPSNCPISCVGTVSYADGAATSGDNEVQVAIRNPTIEIKVSDSTNQSVYQENDQRNDQEMDDEQSPELREAQVHRVNVLGFKSTVSIGTYSGAFSESLSSFVRQFKDQMRAADAEASETAQVYAFLTFLVGNARDRAEEFLNEKADATVDQLVADLKATFESELTSKLKMAQFNKCRQEHGESIEKYYNRVRVLAAQAFRCEERQTIEKKARDAFLNGLDDTIRYNEILREDRLASQQYAPTVALLEEMRSLKNDWYNSQEGQNNWHNNQDEEKSRRFNGSCFYCGIFGHTARDCQKKKAGFPRVIRTNEEAVMNHQIQQRPAHVNATTTDDLLAQLEVYKQQVEELQRINNELLSEQSNARDVRSLAWPEKENKKMESKSSFMVNSAHFSQIPLTAQIPISINGFRCFALVDTGSTITVASQSFSRRIGVTKLHQASASHAVAIGGNEVQMAGAAFVSFAIGSFNLIHRVHFTENECTPEGPRDYSIVLGNDLLSQLPQFSIDYIRSMFHMGEDVLPIGNRHITCNPEVLDVNVLEESVVSAKNESFISCSMPTTAVVSNAGYLIRSQCLTQKSLLTAPLLVKSKNFRILVTNPTDFAVTLPPGTKAAEAIELCEDEIKSI
uniref:CCHC-type domain-containing protein n=1 Tax=Caenorhabditis japonica TaxID=281687 RepID=A0A8R1ERE3_CAEJA